MKKIFKMRHSYVDFFLDWLSRFKRKNEKRKISLSSDDVKKN